MTPPFVGGMLARNNSTFLSSLFAADSRTDVEKAVDLTQELMETSWYDLDDSLLSEASSVLQGKGEQLSKVKEFSDLENTLSLAVKVNNIYERVHKIQNEIADPLGDIVPAAGQGTFLAAEELFRQYEEIIHTVQPPLDRKVAQELGRQMVVLKSSVHSPGFRSRFDFKGPEIRV